MGRVRLNLSIICTTALLVLCLPGSAAAASPFASVSLTSPTSGELFTTAQPGFAGTASTGPLVQHTVTVHVYPGASAAGTPAQTLHATPGSTGAWSVTSSAPLGDGQYTAQAEQSDILGGQGLSRAVTFRIKVHPPALTLTHPAAGGSVSRFDVFFSGQAGAALGDSPSVTVSLYRGANAIGSEQVRATGSSWFALWPRTLRPGMYTVRAAQSDDAGHTTRVNDAFRVVLGPKKTIGSFVTLNRSGMVAVPVSCLAHASVTCAGTILILTAQRYRTTPGGPYGRLEVMYVYARIPGGKTELVRGRAQKPVAALLRRRHGATVRITSVISKAGGRAARASAVRTLYLR